MRFLPSTKLLQISAYLPEDLAQFVKQQCETLNLTESTYVRNLILDAQSEYLKSIVPSSRSSDEQG